MRRRTQPIQTAAPMLARVARAALFLATMFVVSTLARSAFASSAYAAPFCDDRGATALAPPPVLVAPEAALQKARATACDPRGTGDGWMAMFRQARAEVGAAPEGPGPAGLPPEPPLSSPPSSVVHESEVAGHPAAGARSRVERPPRA